MAGQSEPEAIVGRARALVASFAGVPQDRLLPNTTMFGDLGVDGMDGYELVTEFCREFEVDAASFDTTRHFGPEAGATPISLLIYLYRYLLEPSASPEERQGLVAIRFHDFVEAARNRKWPAL
jgi:acyl carrier protein